MTAIAASSISTLGAITSPLPGSSRCSVTTAHRGSLATSSRGLRPFGAKARPAAGWFRRNGIVQTNSPPDGLRQNPITTTDIPAAKVSLDDEWGLVYDWQCPACNLYCHLLEAGGQFRLVNARDNPEVMKEITARPWDVGQTIYPGGPGDV